MSLSGYDLSVTSISSDFDGNIVSYSWGWNDGSSNDITKSPSHKFTKAGTYKISLSVVDDYGDVSQTVYFYVSVPTSLPVASFTVTSNLLDVEVDATGSTDPHGTIDTFLW